MFFFCLLVSLKECRGDGRRSYAVIQVCWRNILLLGNGETDIENRLMDMGRGEERVRCMESNVKTCITVCKIDSQREFAIWLRKLK